MRVTPDSKPHERNLLEVCGGMNAGMAVLCSWEQTAGNWTKWQCLYRISKGTELHRQRFPERIGELPSPELEGGWVRIGVFSCSEIGRFPAQEFLGFPTQGLLAFFSPPFSCTGPMG